MQRRVTIYGVLAFVTVMCAIYVGMHELASSKRSKSGLMTYPGKAVELVFRSKPIVELDHEILEDVHTPKEKRVPIYGHDRFCPICDPNKANGMTENQLSDHLWARHDKLHLKKDSIRAKWRAKRTDRELNVKKKEKEGPKLTLVSEEKAKAEWKEKVTKESAQARLDLIKKQTKTGEMTKEQAAINLAQLKADLQKNNGNARYPTNPTSEKPELQRKVREIRPLSKPISQAPPASTTPIKIAQPKTNIDDLFDQLSKEKEMN
jgi:hypothetical protein